jgi:hypothetical protein
MSIAVYLIEAGLILTIAPWTVWWQRNYFADVWPVVGAAMAVPAARWLVVGIGVLTTLAGMSELRQAIVRRLSRGSSHASPESTSS